ncbi:MAG: DUF2589 domain-containing protein [Lachnospiraceae bacterium]|nr:DUF2589 domain-containing protein [Lachnospiraceae bacterium]MBQ7956387.1 DUF2589 domain-containing protein [Lachnospiraceae bacterium]
MEDEKKLLNVEDEKENTKVGAPIDYLKGLSMSTLISAPLIAVNEAQQQLVASTLDYYYKVACEDDEKKRCLEFKLQRPVELPGGIEMQEVQEKTPLLSIVPISSIMNDEVNVDFKMENTTSCIEPLDTKE